MKMTSCCVIRLDASLAVCFAHLRVKRDDRASKVALLLEDFRTTGRVNAFEHVPEIA